jgi:hypothetical protein
MKRRALHQVGPSANFHGSAIGPGFLLSDVLNEQCATSIVARIGILLARWFDDRHGRFACQGQRRDSQPPEFRITLAIWSKRVLNASGARACRSAETAMTAAICATRKPANAKPLSNVSIVLPFEISVVGRASQLCSLSQRLSRS